MYTCEAIGSNASHNCSRLVRLITKVDSELICFASARSVTSRSLMPRASRYSVGAIVAPRMLAASESVSAANCPIVSMLSRFSLIFCDRADAPQSTHRQLPPNNRCSSTRQTNPNAVGFTGPEIILAIDFPDPAPTKAIKPVSSHTRGRKEHFDIGG